MKRIFLLFSHQLTSVQKKELKDDFQVNEFIRLPLELQVIWSNIPSATSSIKKHLKSLFNWLKEEANGGDLVLVQGEFGAVFMAVDFCLKNGLTPIYATTKREVTEETLSAEAVEIKRIFTHVRFRKFEEWVSRGC
jgi:hypothetical protein